MAGVSYGCAHYARKYLPNSFVTWRDPYIAPRDSFGQGVSLGMAAFGGLYAAHLVTSVPHMLGAY